jgi:hypothetical protein
MFLTRKRKSFGVFDFFRAQKHCCGADPGENFIVAPDPATSTPTPAPTLLYSKPKLLKGVKVNIRSHILFSSDSV